MGKTTQLLFTLPHLSAFGWAHQQQEQQSCTLEAPTESCSSSSPQGSLWALTLLLQPGPLLDEADEGGDASARPDHDHGRAGLEGQPELRLPDVHGHQGAAPVLVRHLVLEPVGGHPFVQAACLGLVLHRHGTDVDGVGMNLQGRDAGTRQGRSPGKPTLLPCAQEWGEV